MPKPQNPLPPGVRRRITIIEELEPLSEASAPLGANEARPQASASQAEPVPQASAPRGVNPPLCPWHRPPRSMTPVGASSGADGGRLVLYACSDPECRYREGWGPDPRSGQPRRLIRGFDQGRR